MSYAIPFQTSPKAFYMKTVDGFYNSQVYNQATNTMVNTSSFPFPASAMAGAVSRGLNTAESLTCASSNPNYYCASSHDCPGQNSNCPNCVKNKCQK